MSSAYRPTPPIERTKTANSAVPAAHRHNVRRRAVRTIMGTEHEIPPRIAFLGVCDALNYQRNFDPRLRQLDVLRLRFEVVSHIYPLPLRNLYVMLAVYDPSSLKDGELIAVDEVGAERFRLQLSFYKPTEQDDPIPGSRTDHRSDPRNPWLLVGTPWPKTFPVVSKPGFVEFFWVRADRRTPVGALYFYHVPAPPLSPEVIAALKSEPRSGSKLRLSLGCSGCGDRLRAYAGFERDTELEAQGHGWYRDLPDMFKCSCGKNEFSLTYIRDNLHGLLGGRVVVLGDEVSFTRMYEHGALQTIYEQAEHLISGDPDEEAVQIFFKEYPVLLQMFSPEKIFAKAPILTAFKTDFAVLSKTGHLRLIELEKPGKRLLKRAGRSAEFTQACDQVLNWLHEFRDHRATILHTLGIEQSAVTKVTGVVIMGRDKEYNPGDLLRLKSADLGVEFFTYDDVLSSLAGLIRDLARL